jgi:hypothetical protein
MIRIDSPCSPGFPEQKLGWTWLSEDSNAAKEI